MARHRAPLTPVALTDSTANSWFSISAPTTIAFFPKDGPMFPRYLRCVFLVCVIGNVLQLLFTGFQVYAGSVPASKLIMPIVMIVVFGWIFTQSTKTN